MTFARASVPQVPWEGCLFQVFLCSSFPPHMLRPNGYKKRQNEQQPFRSLQNTDLCIQKRGKSRFPCNFFPKKLLPSDMCQRLLGLTRPSPDIMHVIRAASRLISTARVFFCGHGLISRYCSVRTNCKLISVPGSFCTHTRPTPFAAHHLCIPH